MWGLDSEVAFHVVIFFFFFVVIVVVVVMHAFRGTTATVHEL